MPSRIFPCKIVVLTIQFIWTLYVTKLIYRYKYKVRACGVRSKKGEHMPKHMRKLWGGGKLCFCSPTFFGWFYFYRKGWNFSIEAKGPFLLVSCESLPILPWSLPPLSSPLTMFAPHFPGHLRISPPLSGFSKSLIPLSLHYMFYNQL